MSSLSAIRVVAIAFLMLASTHSLAQAPKLDGAKIDQAISGKGAWIEAEGVYKVTFPRSDVPIAVDGRKMEPFMGFTSWAAFQPGKAADAMVGATSCCLRTKSTRR